MKLVEWREEKCKKEAIKRATSSPAFRPAGKYEDMEPIKLGAGNLNKTYLVKTPTKLTLNVKKSASSPRPGFGKISSVKRGAIGEKEARSSTLKSGSVKAHYKGEGAVYTKNLLASTPERKGRRLFNPDISNIAP